MILLLGSIGWGLFLAGALSHLTHLDRLEELLGPHTQHSRAASRLLAGAETTLALAFPVGVLLASALLTFAAVAGFVLATGFTLWVLRLKLSGSTLPCACSFAATPTTWKAVARAAATMLIGAALFASPTGVTDDLPTLLTGAAAAMAVYLLPDALTWPEFSFAMKQYADRHPGPTMVPITTRKR